MTTAGTSDGLTPRERWLRVLPTIGGVGVLASLLFCSQVPAGVRWSTFGTALMVAAAAALLGGLLGFLFGIPRTIQNQNASGDQAQFLGNTNLEQVSDWLTKIIVGVGLIQIGRSLPALGKLGQDLKAPLGGLASSSAFGLALVLAYGSLGFLFLYLWSRERLPQELLASTTIQQTLDAHDSAQSSALTLVNQQLNSQKGGTPPTQDQLNAAVVAASDATRLQIFDMAERVRAANWNSDKAAMATSIPVFRALVAADTANAHHRSHGSLGWALKDQQNPAWQDASDELTKAIQVRDAHHVVGWKLYETNRAVCLINVMKTLVAGDPKIATMSATVVQDLQAAAGDQYAQPMIDSDPDLLRWTAAHAGA